MPCKVLPQNVSTSKVWHHATELRQLTCRGLVRFCRKMTLTKHIKRNHLDSESNDGTSHYAYAGSSGSSSNSHTPYPDQEPLPDMQGQPQMYYATPKHEQTPYYRSHGIWEPPMPAPHGNYPHHQQPQVCVDPHCQYGSHPEEYSQVNHHSEQHVLPPISFTPMYPATPRPSPPQHNYASRSFTTSLPPPYYDDGTNHHAGQVEEHSDSYTNSPVLASRRASSASAEDFKYPTQIGLGIAMDGGVSDGRQRMFSESKDDLGFPAMPSISRRSRRNSSMGHEKHQIRERTETNSSFSALVTMGIEKMEDEAGLMV